MLSSRFQQAAIRNETLGGDLNTVFKRSAPLVAELAGVAETRIEKPVILSFIARGHRYRYFEGGIDQVSDTSRRIEPLP